VDVGEDASLRHQPLGTASAGECAAERRVVGNRWPYRAAFANSSFIHQSRCRQPTIALPIAARYPIPRIHDACLGTQRSPSPLRSNGEGTG
jgi:hypothetical protein